MIQVKSSFLPQMQKKTPCEPQFKANNNRAFVFNALQHFNLFFYAAGGKCLSRVAYHFKSIPTHPSELSSFMKFM